MLHGVEISNIKANDLDGSGSLLLYHSIQDFDVVFCWMGLFATLNTAHAGLLTNGRLCRLHVQTGPTEG